MNEGHGGLRSGQLADAAGVNPQTLRYYERRGLLAEPGRTLGGHRLYPAEALTVLRVIKAAQRLGFTLEEIADLLPAAARRHGRSDAPLVERAKLKLTEVEERLADLTAIRKALQQTIDAACSDLIACAEAPDCPLPFAEPARPSPKSAP